MNTDQYKVKEMTTHDHFGPVTHAWFVSIGGRQVSKAYHTKVEAEREAKHLTQKAKIEEEERDAEIAEEEAKASDARFVRFLREFIEGHGTEGPVKYPLVAIRDAWEKDNH